MSLATSALLSTLTITQWSARKLDRKVSNQVCVDNDADVGSGNFNKQLIPKEFLKGINKIVNSTRNYHYDNTLAWGHDGTELLPANHYLKYTQVMENYKAEFEAEVENFIHDYPSLLTKVINNLNQLYNSADYPSQESLRHRFQMSYVITPVPEQGDFRIDLPADELKKLSDDLNTRLEGADELAAQDLYRRLYTVVAKAIVTLKTPDKIFRNSLILNIIDLTTKVPDLNFNKDGELNRISNEIAKLVHMMDIEALREKEGGYRITAAEDLTKHLLAIESSFYSKWGEI